RDRERLTTEQRGRLDQAMAALQAAGGGGGSSVQTGPAAAMDIDSLVLGSEPAVELAEEEPVVRPPDTPEEREEHAILQRLARRVWWDELEGFVLQVAASWRSQRDRYTARIAYATLQNLRRNVARNTFVR